MILGYNTNGFSHHRLVDAIRILAGLGYRALALTPDVHHLDVTQPGWEKEAKTIGKILDDHGMVRVIETGARFILDPNRKHRPTLLEEDKQSRQIRRDYLIRSMDLATQLGSPLISFWAGKAFSENGPREKLRDRLVEECFLMANEAATRGLRIGFEPEPGMLVETTSEGLDLVARVGHPAFCLTIDIGHLQCMGENIKENLDLALSKTINIHFEDMRCGVHDHLPPGEGEIDLVAVMNQMLEKKFDGPVCVELSRHSHDAVATATETMNWFKGNGFALASDGHGDGGKVDCGNRGSLFGKNA
ncbi:MAG: sugar phosphate isomerase/epimerase family protein [Gemmataceae bacterium]